MAERLRTVQGIEPIEQSDQTYFCSINVCEPGGVLFKIATDFLKLRRGREAGDARRDDENAPHHEPHVAEIEAALPKLDGVHHCVA